MIVLTAAGTCSITRESQDEYRNHEAVVRRDLNDSSYRALRSIRCHSNGHELTLHGRVPSYFLKQMAQEMVRRLLNRIRIVNLIEVHPIQGRQTTAQDSGI